MANNLQLALALVFVLAATMSAILFLVALQTQAPRNRLALSLRQLSRPWDFSVDEVGGFRWFHLFLVSVLCLFLEMLMIRWIAAEVPVFAYFKNIVLIGCFLGFGVGCYLCRRKVNLLAFLVPVCLLVVLIKLPWPALRSVIQQIPYLVAQTSDVDLLGRPSLPMDLLASLAAILLIVLLFALVALAFVPLGQIVGWSLESAGDGALAYTVNVLGSLVGIVLYTLLCFRYQPPAVWFAISGIMCAILLRKLPRLVGTSAVAFLLCVGLVSLGPPAPQRELWSPYQKITLLPRPQEHPIAYQLSTNGTWYQEIIDLSPGFVADHADLFRSVPVEGNAYNIPYRFYSNPASVLVLGAGTGNDVAAAVRNGAGRVVAVEIDPLILQLGRQLHFEHPYDSPRVETVVDDARSYIQNSHEKFNVIVFSLLDSHTTASYYSNIRIDNYVYTVEAFQAAKRLLQPDGVFIVKFWVTTPWIAARLHNLVETTFDQRPLDMNAVRSDYTTPGRFFIAGAPERIQQATRDPVVRAYLTDNQKAQAPRATLTTDDWPYFYQRDRGIPLSLLMLSVVLMVFCWQLLKRTGVDPQSLDWHFFFLGAGFMLLEAQIVSKMALLFGTTWLVNSIVVGGLLILIAAASMLVRAFPHVSYKVAYTGIFMSLILVYFVPLERFFLPSFWTKVCLATAVFCLPVFFAGIIFLRGFAAANFAGRALGSNLFGALVGGLLESMSLWTGVRSLVVLAVVIYAISCITLRRKAAAPQLSHA